MLTNVQNKIIAQEIAAAFCVEAGNPNLCKQSLSQRLIQNLNDWTFETSFLQNLSVGRHYILTVHRIYNAPSGESKSVMEFRLMDLITGEITEHWEDTDGRIPVFSKVPSMLSEKGLVVVSQNKIFTSTDFQKPRTVYQMKGASYGIVYVPGGVPGTGLPNIQPKPDPTIPGQQPVPVETENFDIAGLFSNPIVLYGGIALAVYFLFLKK